MCMKAPVDRKNAYRLVALASHPRAVEAILVEHQGGCAASLAKRECCKHVDDQLRAKCVGVTLDSVGRGHLNLAKCLSRCLKSTPKTAQTQSLECQLETWAQGRKPYEKPSDVDADHRL